MRHNFKERLRKIGKIGEGEGRVDNNTVIARAGILNINIEFKN